MNIQNYEICRKSKATEYIQNGVEFFVVDMEKKKSLFLAGFKIKRFS